MPPQQSAAHPADHCPSNEPAGNAAVGGADDGTDAYGCQYLYLPIITR
ncbi:MAG: hypothetical protein R3E79_04290 [Caldilineaceae bacterium]